MAESLAPELWPDFRLRLVSHQRNKGRRLLHMLWAVLRYGHREQPVLIDTYSSMNFWYALLCGLLCSMLGYRYYCILHGGNLPYRLHNNPRLTRWLFGDAAKLIAPSAYLQVAFRQAGYEPVVIPNPISIENYPFKLRTQLRPRLLWVRAFDKIYNPQMAIRVLYGLLPKYSEAKLCMVGPDKDGSMKYCKKLAQELGVADRVRFTGLLPKDEWLGLSEEYDIFLNTTNVDNTPVSVIEAMALGLPVISTKVGGIPYLIRDGEQGLLVEAGKEEEMLCAVETLLSNPLRSTSITLNARKHIEESFVMQVAVYRWKALLKLELKFR